MNAIVQPIRQSPADLIRNAAQIAQAQKQMTNEPEAHGALFRIAALLGEALAQLGEPNAAMLASLENVLEVQPPSIIRREPDDWARYLRDTAAILLAAQLKGSL